MIEKVLELVKQYGLEERTDYISFSPEAFRNFINLAPSLTATVVGRKRMCEKTSSLL